MIERKLLLRLVLPLVLLALVSTILIWPPRVEDVLTNLIVEIVSILITVLFVDWILRTREKEKWEHTDVLVRADFASIALKFLVRSHLFLTGGGWHPPEVARSTSQDKPWSLVLEHISLDEIHSVLNSADPEHIDEFTTELLQGIDELIRQHARYSNKLSPEDTNAILELEGALRTLQTELSLLEDDVSLLVLAGDETDLEGVTARHVRFAAEKLYEAISRAIRLFGLAFTRPR